MTSSVVTKPQPKVAYPWMFGPAVDISFFFMPLAIGIACFVLAEQNVVSSSAIWTLIIVNAFGAGPFHWGPTFFAYFDKKNIEYWKSTRTKQLTFFVAPPAIFVATVLLTVALPWVVQLILMIWGLQHIVQQNIGILLLYHNHGRGEAIVDKQLEIKSQHAPTILAGLYFFYRVFLNSPQHLFYAILFGGLTIWAGYYICAYLLQLGKQLREGATLNLPAFGFWVVSQLCLLPLAFWGRNYTDAFVVPLTVHWFQYIGLNYVLVKYKYGGQSKNAENLPKVSPMVLFYASCLFFLGFWAALSLGCTMAGADSSGLQMSVLKGMVFGLGLCHFFADAFLWRFRESYVREATLPYLLQPRRAQRAGR